MGIFDKKVDPDRCSYCKTPFTQLQGGFSFGADAGFGDTILHMQKGCDACGKPVCFDCAAAAADKRGMNGQCICPSCGANLD